MRKLVLAKSSSIYRHTKYTSVEIVKENKLLIREFEKVGYELKPPFLTYFFVEKTGTPKWGYFTKEGVTVGGFSRPSNTVVERELMWFLNANSKQTKKVFGRQTEKAVSLELLISFGGNRIRPFLKQFENNYDLTVINF